MDDRNEAANVVMSTTLKDMAAYQALVARSQLLSRLYEDTFGEPMPQLGCSR